MNEPPDAEREPDGYIRLPWPLVAGGLFLLLAALFAFGLFANRNLRPQVGIVSTPPPIALTTPTAPPVAAPVHVPVSTPTSPATNVSATAAADSPTAIATQAPTQTRVPIAEATPVVQSTVDPALADDIGRAYVSFWRIKSQALLELDPSHLSDVMDGDYLVTTNELIEDLRSEGHAIKTQVVLNYVVVEADADNATIVDNFDDKRVYVAIGTEDVLSSPATDKLSIVYRLKKFSGTWKVVDSARPQ